MDHPGIAHHWVRFRLPGGFCSRLLVFAHTAMRARLAAKFRLARRYGVQAGSVVTFGG